MSYSVKLADNQTHEQFCCFIPQTVGVVVTQEFYLCVTHIEKDTYQLWTMHVPQGVPFAQERVNWHVSDWLVQAEQLNNEDMRCEFGQKLYAALFVGKIGASWNLAQSVAQQLRLRLEIQAQRLAQLPWELLRIAPDLMSVQVELSYTLHPDDSALNEWEDWDATSTETDREDAVIVADILHQLAHSDSEDTSVTPAAKLQDLTLPPKTTDQNVLVALIVGTTMMMLVALGSLWEQQPLKQASLTSTQNTQQNLQSKSTAQITAIAIAQLQQKDAIAAQNSIEELLNRQALPNANTALNAVNPTLANTDSILFLRGRLAWQSLQIEQAQRYWQAAVNQQPDSAEYQNALGFAYYAQGELNQASDAWFQALFLVNQSTSNSNQPSHAHREALTAYAGLALVLHQSSHHQAGSAKLTNEALKLCQKVLSEDPVAFQPQHLRKDWRWHSQAVEDWQLLTSRTCRS